MGKELTNTAHAINHVRSLLTKLEDRSSAGFASSFGTVFDEATIALADIPRIHVLELEMAGVGSGTSKTLTTAQATEVVAKVAGALPVEFKSKLRRMGLNPKYATGIRDAADLADMRHREADAKSGAK